MRVPWTLIIATALLCGCTPKVTEAVKWQHDTTTIERVVMQEVIRHDTTTITANQEGEFYKVIYDTLERVKEVEVTRWRDRVLTEQAATDTKVVHDTIVMQQSHNQGEAKKSKPKTHPLRWWLTGIGCAAVIYILIRLRCKFSS